jgi:hypothetical protein
VRRKFDRWLKKRSVFEQVIGNQLNSADFRQAGISLVLTLEGWLRPFRAELVAEGVSLDEFSAYRLGKKPEHTHRSQRTKRRKIIV